MIASATRSWNKIEKWYAANAPGEQMNLPGPASEEDIRRLEVVLGCSIPDDLKASYLVHDGSGGIGIFPYGYYLLALTEVANEWTFWRDALHWGSFDTNETSPVGAIRPVWWDEKWIPITGSGGGDHDCVDMNPPIGGIAGQIIEFSHETGPRRIAAPGFAVWLEEFAQNLEAGQYRFDEDSSTLLPVDPG